MNRCKPGRPGRLFRAARPSSLTELLANVRACPTYPAKAADRLAEALNPRVRKPAALFAHKVKASVAAG